MHAVIRMYSGSGAKKLIEVLDERKKDVETLIRPVKGIVSYSLIKTADGGASVTVCQDKAGTDESLRLAKDWISEERGQHGRDRSYRLRGHRHTSPEVIRHKPTSALRPPRLAASFTSGSGCS